MWGQIFVTSVFSGVWVLSMTYRFYKNVLVDGEYDEKVVRGEHPIKYWALTIALWANVLVFNVSIVGWIWT